MKLWYNMAEVVQMLYLYSLIALAVLWALNAAIGQHIGKVAGQDSTFFSTSVKNSNNIFYCLFGVAGVAVSYFLFELFKWVVTGYYLLTFVVSFALFVFSVITQIVFSFRNKIEWEVIFSNFLPILGNVVVLSLAYMLLW